MDNEKFTISPDGVRRLEYAVNYVLHNISSLNDVCGDTSAPIISRIR